MAIVLPTAPDEGMELIRRHVPSLLAAGGITDVFDGADKAFFVARPQPIYTGTARDVVDRRILAGANLTGWQYVILTDESVFAAAEIGNKEGKDEWAFTVLRFLGASRPIGEALNAAEELPEIDDADYELRILRSPGVFLRALWLHPLAGANDLLIPIDRTPRGIKPNTKYTETELADALFALAAARTAEPA